MTQCMRWLSITLVILLVSISLLLFLIPKPPLLTEISFSRAVYDEHHRLLRLTLSQDGKYRLKTSLADMSPQLIEGTLLQEDQYFYWHIGVNPLSLIKATWQTYGLQSRRIGASTITMQVARMRFGLQSKTLSGKLWQILRAFQLERHYSKKEILEAYLNLAPYGNNVEGVGAASLIYFGTSARAINLPQALTLVVIPQNPNKRLPQRNVLKEVRDKLYARWIKQHPGDSHQQAIMSLPLQMLNVRATPFLAPHFVNAILTDATLYQAEIVTTLDLRMQTVIERVTRLYLARKANFNVNNAAVMIVDTRDMGIKALMGSADFFNVNISGQVNGTLMRRSPGSTLKPFIYALALDQGLIHPGTVLKDVPRSFGHYNPENFDYDFTGPIKAQDALVLSRNIPAVYLADQLKRPSLYDFLQQAGISHLKTESYYGLALALGGAELSMQELVSLYAALANDGMLRALRKTRHEGRVLNRRLLSPEASFLTLEMLKDHSTSQPIPIAWKTGTSSGFRDAWTLGVVGPYVVAVWIGNFNNQSNPAFVGKDIAAPLFLEIVNAMRTRYGLSLKWHQEINQRHLTQVSVCKASGMLPTRYCTERENVWFIPGKSPIKTDTIHREVAINTKTGKRTCHFNEHTRFDVYEFWSSDLLSIFKRAGMARRIPPPFDETCVMNVNANGGFHPQIISPQSAVSYVTRLDPGKKTMIPFTAVVDADVRQLHWFVNETYVGKTTRDKAFLWPALPGHYVVRVVDDYGRAHAQNLQVRVEA